MTTFIRAAEIWVPDAEGHLLEFGSGLYGHAPVFGALSRSMCFGRGEGLPGRVWDEARPVVLQDLQGGHFQRAAAARAAGLTCAVAFPVYFDTLLKAVVVLFCGDVANQSGAIEVWHRPGGATSDLRLLDGVYGARDAAFEAVSRGTSLAPGEGLPGRALERQASVFVNGLATSPAFARGDAAAATGLRRGIAIPCAMPGADPYVLTFLSAPTTPVASRLESWVAGADAQSLRRAYGFDERDGELPALEVAAGDVDRAVFSTFAAGVPTVGAPGAAPLIALPVVRDGAVVETVAMTL